MSKAKEELSKTKEKYEQALSEISSNNPKYIEVSELVLGPESLSYLWFFQDMTHVFEKTQDSEQERLEFIKKMLFATHKCLNVSQDPRFVLG